MATSPARKLTKTAPVDKKTSSCSLPAAATMTGVAAMWTTAAR
ncbi:hypothetical protein [Streptomyces sp. NPDC048385]